MLLDIWVFGDPKFPAKKGRKKNYSQQLGREGLNRRDVCISAENMCNCVVALDSGGDEGVS